MRETHSENDTIPLKMLYMTVWAIKHRTFVNNFAYETAEINIEVKHLLGETAFIWSSTETEYQSNYEPEAYNLWITNHSFRRYEEVSIDRSKKSHYLSVRCVKKKFYVDDAGTPIFNN